MNPQSHPQRASEPGTVRNQCFDKAFRLLLDALEAAAEEREDAWEFAVEIGQFHAAGLSNTEIRWLLRRSYVVHAEELTPPGASRRSFRTLGGLVLPARTCFVLAAKGIEVARAHTENGASRPVTPEEQAEANGARGEVPHWDSATRKLWWGGHLIKAFRVPAANQETVLAALEEEGWPARIDDPLPQTVGVDPKVRIHDTIKSLNRNQIHRLIRFQGDGNGRGVRWVTMKRGGTELP